MPEPTPAELEEITRACPGVTEFISSMTAPTDGDAAAAMAARSKICQTIKAETCSRTKFVKANAASLGDMCSMISGGGAGGSQTDTGRCRRKRQSRKARHLVSSALVASTANSARAFESIASALKSSHAARAARVRRQEPTPEQLASVKRDCGNDSMDILLKLASGVTPSGSDMQKVCAMFDPNTACGRNELISMVAQQVGSDVTDTCSMVKDCGSGAMGTMLKLAELEGAVPSVATMEGICALVDPTTSCGKNSFLQQQIQVNPEAKVKEHCAALSSCGGQTFMELATLLSKGNPSAAEIQGACGLVTPGGACFSSVAVLIPDLPAAYAQYCSNGGANTVGPTISVKVPPSPAAETETDDCAETYTVAYTGAGQKCNAVVGVDGETAYWFVGRVGLDAGWACSSTDQAECEREMRKLGPKYVIT